MKSPQLTIRFAQHEDVPLVLSFIRDLADYEQRLHEVVATEEQLAESLFGPRPAAEVLLAFLGDEPAGFAVFFPIYSTFLGKRQLYLEDLLVRKAARGHGVGRAIMAALARIAQERGCHLLQWSVLKWNDPAIRFYRGLGATEHGGWDSYQLGGASLTRLAAEFAESVG